MMQKRDKNKPKDENGEIIDEEDLKRELTESELELKKIE
jgi:hypothetical protein